MPKYSDIALPDFYTDPYFKQSQEALFPFGSDLLKGDVPDYYKPIGEFNSQQFQDVLGMTTRDITQRATETGARLKMRGPRLASGISRAVGDTSKQMRYADYARSISGRQGLMDRGISVTEGVGGRALQYGGQKNQFALNRTNISMDLAKAEQAKKAAKAKRWSGIIESGMGLLGTAAGFAMGGPVGAGIGGTLAKGAASGGGGGTTSFGGGEYDLQEILKGIQR